MNNIKGKLPRYCPSCGDGLKIQRLHCPSCTTEVEGLFELPALLMMSWEDQQFILDFVKSSGSLKEMARLLNLSYPTVRNKLDEIIEQLNQPSDEQA